MQSSLFATHQWIEVNRFTKQYSWFYPEEDLFFYDPIGWEYQGEPKEIVKCLKIMGYSETNFHYTLDIYILTILGFLTSIIIFLVNRLKRKRSNIQ